MNVEFSSLNFTFCSYPTIEIWQYLSSEHEACESQIHLEEQQNRNPLLLVPSYMIPE